MTVTELRVGADDFNDIPAPRSSEPPQVMVATLEEFTAVEEEGAAPYLGSPDNIVIPENGDVMVYGDGGAGKTTLCIDLSLHLACGIDWLGIGVPQPVRVLVIENEGPRALFRRKLAAKRAAWDAGDVEDRLLVWEQPWADFTFAHEQQRDLLAHVSRTREVDVVLIGPLTASGMNEAGTLQDVRAFMKRLDDVRERAARRLTFALVHHENKGGQVSGAWEGGGDTLIHVQGLGHGRTKVFFQKARWASEWHGRSLSLLWAEGESFTVDEHPELTDTEVAELILREIAAAPGDGWTKVRDAISGVENSRIDAVRDGLFAQGNIVNVVGRQGEERVVSEVLKRTQSHLYICDDPAYFQLCRARGIDAAQSVPCAAPKGESSPGTDGESTGSLHDEGGESLHKTGRRELAPSGWSAPCADAADAAHTSHPPGANGDELDFGEDVEF